MKQCYYIDTARKYKTNKSKGGKNMGLLFAALITAALICGISIPLCKGTVKDEVVEFNHTRDI